MGPQELIGIAPDDILDHLDEAARIFLDIGCAIAAALNRNLIVDFDSMGALIRLAYDKGGHHRRPRNRDDTSETAGGRRWFAEERHKNGLAALGVLVERDSDRFAAPQCLQQRTSGRMLAQDLDSRALANECNQRVSGEKTLRMMDQ